MRDRDKSELIIVISQSKIARNLILVKQKISNKHVNYKRKNCTDNRSRY